MRGIIRLAGVLGWIGPLAVPAQAEQGGASFAVTVQIVPSCVRRFDFGAPRPEAVPGVATGASAGCSPGQDVAARLQAEARTGFSLPPDAGLRVQIADLDAGKRITLTSDAAASSSTGTGIWRLLLDF